MNDRQDAAFGERSPFGRRRSRLLFESLRQSMSSLSDRFLATGTESIGDGVYALDEQGRLIFRAPFSTGSHTERESFCPFLALLFRKEVSDGKIFRDK